MISVDCREWLRRAEQDIYIAHNAFFREPVPRNRPIEEIMWHCQQAAEKAMKAYIINQGILPKYTHKLNDLRIACSKFNPKFNNKRVIDHCAFLDPYGVNVRYPAHGLVLGSDVARRGLNSAKRVYDFICGCLGSKKIYFP